MLTTEEVPHFPVTTFGTPNSMAQFWLPFLSASLSASASRGCQVRKIQK